MQAPIEQAPGRPVGARRGAARLDALEVISRSPQLGTQFRQLRGRHAAELAGGNRYAFYFLERMFLGLNMMAVRAVLVLLGGTAVGVWRL